MSTAKSDQHATPPPGHPAPLIPESYFDVPTQRLYVLSFGLLCQAIKLFDVFQYLLTFDEDSPKSYVTKWIIADVIYVLGLSQLRIPRLRYSAAVVTLQIMTLCFTNAILFGGISINLGLGLSLSSFGLSGGRELAATTSQFRISDIIPSFGFLSSPSYGKDPHLLGQHTVRMSPISTAQLNPHADTFCLNAPGGSSVLIPVLLNNTNLMGLRYTITPLGFVEGVDAIRKIETIDLTAKDLKAVEQSRLEVLQLTRSASPSSKLDADDPDYDEYDDDEQSKDGSSSTSLQKSQTLAHIRLTKPGTIRLERVLDTSNVDARLIYPWEVTVAPCPRAEFVPDEISRGNDVRCASPGIAPGHSGSAAGEDLKFNLDIFGVPPLSLQWFKDVNGKREHFTVEGIEADQVDGRTRTLGSGVAQMLQVPLTVSLDAIGTHNYALESVTDRFGNHINIGASAGHTKSEWARSITVLRRPNASFKTCGPGKPSLLLIGSETPITITTYEADPLDAPWDVTVKYLPLSNKRHKPWQRKLKTQKGQRDLVLKASAPGEYTILGVRGAYCEGDVLSPEVCKVVEMPYPSAEIEWKKIHECSGDTGVSASLVLHGTPPFQVYYRMQRDKESPQEFVKTFATSRADFAIQPDQSGYYSFSFMRLSDANYNRVDLKGPSIDQLIHPLASVDFAHSGGVVNGKKSISSCGGSFVDVDVDLKGTGPWNLEVQVVGPEGSTIVPISHITAAKHRMQIPIPAEVDKEGGIFEVDLVSIEDDYGCKRPISVPGISVNVRRIKPMAKFYGKDKRELTILEQETAELPLRLTGDGPWRLKYRRTETPNDVRSIVLRNPNEKLVVSQEGLYEIIEVIDSQCIGSVVPEESTYLVKWVPRPFARLSSETESTYDYFNGSHILPPICEGVNDHVDLDLTGRPPFQIMYNVARDNEAGGINLLDQPIFNSIQSRTRFQLRTNEAGRIYYEVKQIGDAAYPLAKHHDFIIPRVDRLLFEQEVLMRPSAKFRNTDRMSYCLNDLFVPRDSYSFDGLIAFEGTLPLTVNLSIKNLAAGETFATTVEVKEMNWGIELPNYTFKSIGPYLVTIDSIQDASRCDQTVPDPLYRSIWVDVVETAAIVPFDRREHFCEGEVSQFQLEGNPPWTIGYRMDGKLHTQEAKTSPFSLIQQQAGEFAIVSVAHQQKMCKTAVTDLRYTVHPLPSARVGHGKRIIQDIHEGDQAEIVFTLIGEPPFTFTYQRSELNSKKSAKSPKILETHTVSGVTTKEYSIFSALEGTWTVSFISDKYCRYPPASSDTVLDKRH